jgi:hypothetical protein
MAPKDFGDTSHSADQLAQELKETRERLTRTVSDLTDYVRPSSVASRTLDKVSAFFTDADGEPRAERIAGAVASVVGVLGLVKKSRSKD